VQTRSAILLALLIATPLWAHKLEAECRVLPGRRVRVESWFETGDSPRGASVKVYRADGTLLCEGQLDRDGVYYFRYTRPEALRVEVRDGAGHKAVVAIRADQLASRYPAEAAGLVALCAGSPAAPLSAAALLGDHTHAEALPEKAVAPDEEPRADRSHPLPLKDILAGVGFLLALAAFIISLQNARTLQEIKKGLPAPSQDRGDVPDSAAPPSRLDTPGSKTRPGR
jgi:hypothetical protein